MGRAQKRNRIEVVEIPLPLRARTREPELSAFDQAMAAGAAASSASDDEDHGDDPAALEAALLVLEEEQDKRSGSVLATVAQKIRAAAGSGEEAELIKLLQSAPTDALDSADWGGWTALMHAVSNDRCGTAQILLSRGASIDAVDADGWTALHVCALNDSAKCMPLLLGAGADRAITENLSLRTPAMVAIESGCVDLAKLLQSGALGGVPKLGAGKGKRKRVIETGLAKGMVSSSARDR